MSVQDSPRARRYPMPVVQEARTLMEAGWTPMQIVTIFARRGMDPVPSPGAVRWWAKGGRDYGSHLEHQRRHKARERARNSGGRLLSASRVSAPEFKLARIHSLDKLPGMSCQAIASMMAFDFGDDISEHQVRHALKSGRYPTGKPRAATSKREYEPNGPSPASLHNIPVNPAARAQTERERVFGERHQRMLEHEQRLQASQGGQRFLEKIGRL